MLTVLVRFVTYAWQMQNVFFLALFSPTWSGLATRAGVDAQNIFIIPGLFGVTKLIRLHIAFLGLIPEACGMNYYQVGHCMPVLTSIWITSLHFYIFYFKVAAAYRKRGIARSVLDQHQISQNASKLTMQLRICDASWLCDASCGYDARSANQFTKAIASATRRIYAMFPDCAFIQQTLTKSSAYQKFDGRTLISSGHRLH